ncbi:hypothetical protein [Pseudonocardia acaciae]|uniref:hypothetical protein n=1 Tax=Pseudonocardia acaciae TaxID=551276 RepID=UPI00048E12EE|nr:hypothetical protein [Pseudonocardia acaciae]
MRRAFGIGLAVVLLTGLIAVIFFDKHRELTTVRGVIGSEKMAFFNDPRVRDAFAAHGLRVEVDPAGSREIATRVDLNRYDFAFPSSSPAADKIQRDRKIVRGYAPFSSPIAVATFAPIVELLTRAGVVRQGPGYPVLDMGAYLALAERGVRWDQLPGNTAYPARKNVLLTTTDPNSSSSAAMYLAIASYVANGQNVVTDPSAEARVRPTLTRLLADQGYTQSSSEGPFEDYLAVGIGKTPMVLVYEAQFADRVIRADGSISPDRVLLYPAPTVSSKHTLVPLRVPGNQVGELLTSDPELTRLAASFGFRTQDRRQFDAVRAEHHLPVPADLVDVIEPPPFESLERMLDAVRR